MATTTTDAGLPLTVREASLIVTALEQRELHLREEGEDEVADEVAALAARAFEIERGA